MNEPTNNHCELGDELFFTAIRYALDELSPRARDAFEHRLIVDQQARECLVEAVAVCQHACEGMQAAVEPAAFPQAALMQATADQAAAQPTVVADSRTNVPRRSVAWTCLALAASLLLAVGLSMFNQRGHLPVADTKSDEAGRQLAVAWVTSGEWVDADGGRFGVAGHERRVPADDQSLDDRLAGDNGEADDEFVWLEGGAEPSSDSANDWLFQAVVIPQTPAAGHREG